MNQTNDIFELAELVLSSAREKGLTLGCAESCTGGLIASALTEVPGSSDTFVGGVVSYWVDVKENVLGVPAGIIDEHGVVSEQTAMAMAAGARSVLECDLAVATTGIAGPTGALPGKPVGTVCYGIDADACKRSLTACEGSSRHEVRERATIIALRALLDTIDSLD